MAAMETTTLYLLCPQGQEALVQLHTQDRRVGATWDAHLGLPVRFSTIT